MLQEIEFIKQGSLSPQELDAFVSVLQLAGTKLGQKRTSQKRPRDDTEKVPSIDKSIASLESMGVRVYGLNEPHTSISNGEISWDNIAGYDNQKRYVLDEFQSLSWLLLLLVVFLAISNFYSTQRRSHPCAFTMLHIVTIRHAISLCCAKGGPN